MFWFKSCSQCDGDLYEDNDVYGGYVACLQCGDHLTPTEEAVLRFSAWPAGGGRVGSPAGSPLRSLRGRMVSVREEAAILVSVE